MTPEENVRELFRRLAACDTTAADGDVVLTDRTDVLRLGRWHTSFWVRGTFEVRDGKITLWDDAFSWVDFARGSVLGLAGILR